MGAVVLAVFHVKQFGFNPADPGQIEDSTMTTSQRLQSAMPSIGGLLWLEKPEFTLAYWENRDNNSAIRRSH